MKYWSCSAILSGLLGAYVNGNSQNPSFTVQDDIAMVRFSDPFPRSAVPGSNILQCPRWEVLRSGYNQGTPEIRSDRVTDFGL